MFSFTVYHVGCLLCAVCIVNFWHNDNTVRMPTSATVCFSHLVMSCWPSQCTHWTCQLDDILWCLFNLVTVVFKWRYLERSWIWILLRCKCITAQYGSRVIYASCLLCVRDQLFVQLPLRMFLQDTIWCNNADVYAWKLTGSQHSLLLESVCISCFVFAKNQHAKYGQTYDSRKLRFVSTCVCNGLW